MLHTTLTPEATTLTPEATTPDELLMVNDMFDPPSDTHFTKCDDTVLTSAPNGTTIAAKVIERHGVKKKWLIFEYCCLKTGLHSTVRYWL